MILFLFVFWTLSCKPSNSDLIYLVENPDLNSDNFKSIKNNELVQALLNHSKLLTKNSFNSLKKNLEEQQNKTTLNESDSYIIKIGLAELRIYELNQMLYNEVELDNVNKEITGLLGNSTLTGDKEEAYYHLKYLHLYAKYLEKKSRYKHAISCLHKGRLFLENSSLQEKYRSLYANYLSLLAVCYFHDDNNSVVVSNLINQHPFWKTQKNNLLKTTPALLCLYQQYENASMTEKADSAFKEARSLAKNSQYFLQLNISRYYNDFFLRGSTDGIKHLYNSLSENNFDSVSIGYFDVLKELTGYHLANKNVDSVSVYLSRMLQFDKETDQIHHNLVQYYYFQGLFAVSKIKKKAAYIPLHLLEQKLEYTIKYGGTSFDHHLSDAINDILLEATESLPDNKWVEEENAINSYLNIFHQCDKFLFKKQLFTKLNQDSKYNTEIEALLVKSNDLQNLQQITASYADSLFYAYELQIQSSIVLSSSIGQFVSWATLSDFLNSDGSSVLLSVLGEDKLHLIYITNHGIYRSTISMSLRNNFMNSFPAILSNQKNLANIQKQLPPFDFNKHPLLYIIPSGDSYKIPFDGLPYKNKRLCEWAQSVNVLDLPSIINARDLYFSSSQIKLFGFSSEKTKNETSPLEIVELPSSVEEVNILQKLLHLPLSSVFQGVQMTSDHFLTNSKNSWVHISSHSFTSDTIRRSNSIVFRSKKGYNYFQNADVLKMKAVPGFVFLNSCESGYGVANESEIQNSLANAFHEIGCPSTVSNLWIIKDNTALQFSSDFYSFLLEGCNLGESIRLSKLKNINNNENEYFGYILTGNPKLMLNLENH